MEHEEQARDMERDAEKMEEHSEKVGEHIDETRRDWEAKEKDPSVPGAQPDPDQSDQQDAPREEMESPEVPDEEGTATGNPDAAGSEE
jgi:hypothetical protein